MDDPRLADVRMQDDAVGIRKIAQGSPDFLDRNAEPLGDLTRIRNTPGGQQRRHVGVVDRGLDVGRHVSSLTLRRQPGKP